MAGSVRTRAAGASPSLELPAPPTDAERHMMDYDMLHQRALSLAEDTLGRHPATAAKRKALAKSIMARRPYSPRFDSLISLYKQ